MKLLFSFCVAYSALFICFNASFCWCWYNTALFMWFNRASQIDFLEETCKMLVTKEPHMNLERNKFLFLFVFYALLSLISLAEGEWYYFIYTTFFYDVAILCVSMLRKLLLWSFVIGVFLIVEEFVKSLFSFFVLHTAPSSFVLTHHFVKISSVVINIGIILPFLCDFAGRVK